MAVTVLHSANAGKWNISVRCDLSGVVVQLEFATVVYSPNAWKFAKQAATPPKTTQFTTSHRIIYFWGEAASPNTLQTAKLVKPTSKAVTRKPLTTE